MNKYPFLKSFFESMRFLPTKDASRPLAILWYRLSEKTALYYGELIRPPGKVWGLTPVNVVFSITTHFHFLLTFQVDVVYNFRFDLFLFLDGRIRQIRRRYREKVSLVLAAFVNPVHSLIRRGKNKQVNTFSLNISPLTADKGLGRTWLIDMSEWYVKC